MLGNEVGHSFTDPEIYYKPQTQYAMRDKDPNDSSKGIAASINEASAEYKEYTLPFNEENFQNLYKQRPTESSSSVSLSIWVEGASDKPRQVVNPEQFKGEFDPLWQEMITPKFKLDRSYRDNLENRHYRITQIQVQLFSKVSKYNISQVASLRGQIRLESTIVRCRMALDPAAAYVFILHVTLSLLQFHFIYIGHYTLDSYSESKCILLTGRCGIV
jgi:hypothetical protein